MQTPFRKIIARDLIKNGQSTVRGIRYRLYHYHCCPSGCGIGKIMNQSDMFVAHGKEDVFYGSGSVQRIKVWDVNREHPEIMKMLDNGDA